MAPGMNARRQKLASYIALQTAAAAPTGNHDISDIRLFPIREPASGRAYTVVRLRTSSGLTGWGEAAAVTSSDLTTARQALLRKPATAWAVTSTGTALDPAITCAMLDITAKAASAPVYRLLGGPTRHKVRAIASLNGKTDADLARSLSDRLKSGYLAFEIPAPAGSARNHGQQLDNALRTRMDTLRKNAPENANFVLHAGGAFTAGDAGAMAGTLEPYHLLWFDEPCPATNLRTIAKITEETVTPLGFGRTIREPSVYQDLLREGLADILRPSLHHEGIARIRQIAALAETYYVAVAPYHDGGPIATAMALHLAASLPNFFIQQIPVPEDERDRRMRSEIVAQPVEAVTAGFAALPAGPGLGIQVNESALEKYKEAGA